MATRATWKRRIILPLFILAIAAVVAVWGSQQRQRRNNEVEAFVTALCGDLAAGRDPALNAGDVLAGPLRSRLAEVIRVAARRPLSIEVAAGDTPEAGRVPRAATHTAVLRVDGTAELGLRLLHDGRPGNIAIIGFWTPPAP